MENLQQRHERKFPEKKIGDSQEDDHDDGDGGGVNECLCLSACVGGLKYNTERLPCHQCWHHLNGTTDIAGLRFVKPNSFFPLGFFFRSCKRQNQMVTNIFFKPLWISYQPT